MIPVELSLRNFMSYGEETPPLDFTLLHLACLSGPNGAGKSALLDAITWALWGEARKPRGAGTARPDAHLIRMGATEMQVRFVFDLEGDRYLVQRTYALQRSGGRTSLELQIHDPGQQAYHPLTEPNLRATQQKITDLLRMDYQTFVNSAFLMQGRADEFSRRTPRERKQVLAEILGLSYYDRLSDKARERARERRARAQACEATLEQFGEQLKARPALREELHRLQADLQGVETGLQGREEEAERLQERARDLHVQQQRLENLRDSQVRLNQALDTLRSQQEAAERQWQEAASWLEREEDIRRRRDEYERLRRLIQEMDGKAERRRELEEEAQSLREIIAGERQRLQSDLENRRRQLADIEVGLRGYQDLLAEAQAIREGAAGLNRVREELRQQEERRRERDELEEQARELEQNLARRRAEWEGRRQALQRELEKLRADANAEPALRARLQEMEGQLRRLEQVQGKREQVLAEREQLRSRLAGLRDEYQRAQEQEGEARERLEMLTGATAAICPLCRTELGPDGLEHVRLEYEQQLHGLAEKQQALQGDGRRLQKDLKQQEAQLEEWDGALHGLPELQRTLAALRQQWEAARDARAALGEREEQLGRLERELEEGSYAPEATRQLAELRRRQQEVGYDPPRHRQLQEEDRRLSPFAARLGQLEEAERQAQRLESLRPDLQQQAQALEEGLERHHYAREEQERFQELKRRADELGYDREEHRRLQQEAQERSRVLVEIDRLEEILRRRPEMERQREALRAQVEGQEAQRQAMAAEMETLAQSAGELPGVRAALEEAVRERNELRRRQAELQQQVSRASGQLEHLDQLDEQRREVEQERTDARRRQDLYERLTVAFGKDGIQAWLIERAIPEIEASANELLQRLTQGQAQITIEPLRDLKTGGVRETLDINISDSAGTRPYEMFSGGEAFRIDFALRIALSQLLVGRAGARLRTLVIDEGFGTQDREGLLLLVDAIQQVAEDFDKILVVTHLDELKDAFPVRIEVTKLPDRGSWYEVVA